MLNEVSMDASDHRYPLLMLGPDTMQRPSSACQPCLQGMDTVGAAQFNLAEPLQLNFLVLVLMTAVSLLTGVIFGLFPALEVTAVDLHSALAETSRGGTASSRQRKRQILVFAEVALGVVLVMSAGFAHAVWIPLHLAAFFVGCIACHGALAQVAESTRNVAGERLMSHPSQQVTYCLSRARRPAPEGSTAAPSRDSGIDPSPTTSEATTRVNASSAALEAT